MIVEPTASFVSRQFPADVLHERARRLAPRKVMRLLDRATIPAFVAVMEAFLRCPDCDPARVALFTVSGWDPTVPAPPFPVDSSRESRTRLASYYADGCSPTGWLRGMPNSVLCQASIAAGFRGPNAHFVGGAATLRRVLVISAQSLEDRTADITLVTAYDMPAGQCNRPPAETESEATSLALRRARDRGDVFAEIIAIAGRADVEAPATQVLEECLAACSFPTHDG